MELLPFFVDVLPPFEDINDGEIWISHKHRTVNLRCPCGCGELTVLSLHPSRWHVHFDGKSVTLEGPTGGSVWANSGCGSHYHIRNNAVLWSDRIDPGCHSDYAATEQARLLDSTPNRQKLCSQLGHMWRSLWLGVRRRISSGRYK